MKKYKSLLAVLLAGTMVFTTVPVQPVYATTDDIIVVQPDEDQDIVTPVSDVDIVTDIPEDHLINDEEAEDNTLSTNIVKTEEDDVTDGSNTDDEEYFGYVKPDWVGEPIIADEDLSIEDIDKKIEGEKIIVTEEGQELHVSDKLKMRRNMASIEPISELTDELPSAFPAAYEDGQESDLQEIDNELEARLTATKDQSPYGSCWAHGAIALTEAYQINKQNGNPDSIDNSERHLVYNTFGASSTHTGLGLDSHDSIDLGGANESVFLDQGGNAIDAAITLSKWRGVATENEAPYASIGNDSWTNTEFLSTAGRIENCYLVDIVNNPDIVKRFIMEYGAVGISYYTLSGMTAMTNAHYYNEETNAYFYCDNVSGGNHAVVIVGWDDDFPASAFATDPGSDGAWLVRNSWDRDKSVADKSYSGYFWMSYEDRGLHAEKDAYVYKMQDPDKESEHNYFYDSTYHGSTRLSYGGNYGIEAANIYTVSGSEGYEKLDSVTIQNFCDNIWDDNSYRVEIYSELTDLNKPDSGKLVAVKQGELPFLGLYTVYFDSPVILEKGTTFSVVVTVNGGGKAVHSEITENVARQITKNGSVIEVNETFTAQAGAGQSFYRQYEGNHKYNWRDNTADGYGNFCIGAQTSDYVGNQCNVNIYSRTEVSSNSVADVSIASPKTIPGSEVTVTASDMSDAGYSFVGWFDVDLNDIEDGRVTDYDSASPLCEELQYSFTVQGDTYLVAVYKENGNAQITVNVKNGAKFTLRDHLTVFGGGVHDSAYTRTFRQGKKLIIEAEVPDKVLQWENESGKVLGRGGSITIALNRNMTVTLVYKDEAQDKAFLHFISDYGQMISGEYVSSSDTSYAIPAGPTKYGYRFVNWVFEGTNEEVTVSSIRSRIEAAQGGRITAVPKYSKIDETYNITIEYTDKNGNPIQYNSQAQYIYTGKSVGTGIEVEAPAIDGYIFECWKDTAGNPLGYKPSYYLMVKNNITLRACYIREGQNAHAPEPVIILDDLYKTEEGNGIYKVCGIATRSVPEDYELLEQGMLWARGVNNINGDNFTITSPAANQFVGSKTTLNGYLYLNVHVASDDVNVYLRGYMILKEKSTGNIRTVYSGIKSGSYGSL